MEQNNESLISFDLIKRWMFPILFWAILLIVVLGSSANFLIYQVVDNEDSPISDLLKRFDLGHEPSLPSFFSSALILVGAFAAFANSRVANKAKTAWIIACIVLIGMAIDETVMFHEMLNAGLIKIGIKESPFYFPWTIVGGLFAIFVFIFVFPILVHSPRKYATRFVVAGGVFILGAIGVENVAAYIFSQSGSEAAGVKTISHWVSQTIEESFEMIGMALFITAAIDNLDNQLKSQKLIIRFTEG